MPKPSREAAVASLSETEALNVAIAESLRQGSRSETGQVRWAWWNPSTICHGAHSRDDAPVLARAALVHQYSLPEAEQVCWATWSVLPASHSSDAMELLARVNSLRQVPPSEAGKAC